MDNGHESRQAAQSAREMTAEIDRVTEAEVAKLERQNQPNLDRQQAGSLGSQILKRGSERDSQQDAMLHDTSYNHEQNVIQTERAAIYSNEQVRRQAEREEGYLEAAETDTGITGAETTVQAQEWLAEDQEDVANETGLNGRYVKNLMDRNNKRITKETVAAVDKMIVDNEYHPSKLDRMASKARTDFLKDVFNRILGSRN